MSDMEWLPIESAPSDGRKIIVIGGRHLDVEIIRADGEWWRESGLKAVPTHWMSLPSPPQPSKEK